VTLAADRARGPKLVLVATPIGNLGDISARAIEELTNADSVACEDTRRTGSLFAHFGIAHDPFIVCNEHTERTAADEIVSRIAAGQRVVLVSDAGTPAVSDPGQRVVDTVVAAGHDVESIPGPSAALVALTLSGLATDRFCFDGFLPRKGRDRSERLSELVHERRTTVLFEAPHRLARTTADLAEALGDRRVVLARELTKRYEEVWRGTLTGAVTHTIDVEPRGEYVIVLEGAAHKSAVTDEGLRAALSAERDAGTSRRDAVDTVVAMTGAKKRQVYDLALQLDFGVDEEG